MSESNVDDELVSQVLKGDREAFDLLVLKYQGQLGRVVTSIVHDQVLALDIVQDSFKIYQ